MTDNNAEPDYGEYFAEAFEKTYGQDYTILAAMAIPFMTHGSSWGLITRSQGREFGVRSMDRAKMAEYGAWVYPLGNGFLVYHDFDTLAGRIQDVIPVFTHDVLAKGWEFRVKSQKALDKLLREGESNIRFGFYNLNDSPSITIKGRRYPSYTMDLMEVMRTAEHHGYALASDGALLDEATVQSTMTNDPDSLMKLFKIAPSGNSVLGELVKR